MVFNLKSKVEVSQVDIRFPALSVLNYDKYIMFPYTRINMDERKKIIKNRGYEEPFDESPVAVPEGWSGGEVINTGGGIFCRAWRNFNGSEKQESRALEVIYDVNQDNLVAIQEYEWDGEYYRLANQFDSREAGSSDSDQADVALSYMREYPKE